MLHSITKSFETLLLIPLLEIAVHRRKVTAHKNKIKIMTQKFNIGRHDCLSMFTGSKNDVFLFFTNI
jgi:hypothetical protein